MFTMEEDDEDLKPKQEGNIEVMVKVEVANVDSMTETMEGKEIKVKGQTKTEKNDKEDPLEDKVELTGANGASIWTFWRGARAERGGWKQLQDGAQGQCLESLQMKEDTTQG